MDGVLKGRVRRAGRTRVWLGWVVCFAVLPSFACSAADARIPDVGGSLAESAALPSFGSPPGGVYASANTFSARATHVLYEVGFEATTGLPGSSGFIRVTALRGRCSAKNQDYLITDGSNSRQSGGVQVGPESQGTNVVEVMLPSGFSIAAGDQVRVGVWGVSNPSAANSGGELSVATSSDTTPVAKPFPITLPTAPAEPVMVSANTFSAGASHVLDEVSFKAATAITWGFGEYNPRPGRRGHSADGACGDGVQRKLAGLPDHRWEQFPTVKRCAGWPGIVRQERRGRLHGALPVDRGG